MHRVVHGDEVEAVGGLLVVGVPAVEEHGNVMVPVQEDQRLLAEYYEDCVAKLGNLRAKKRERKNHYI